MTVSVLRGLCGFARQFSAYTSVIRTSGGVVIKEDDYAGLRFKAGDGQWDRSVPLCCLGLVSMSSGVEIRCKT